MQPSNLAKRGTVLLFVALGVFYFYGLGHLPLLGPDEPRYAQVAREMFLRGDLITPTLGGHVWFEKPALLYWLMILGFQLFGVSELAARLGPAICGLLTVAAVFWAGTQAERAIRDDQTGGTGFWSALVAGTSIGLIAFSRAASFDVVVTMTIGWALAFFITAELEENLKRRRLLLAGFYAAIGLALLAKGLIGLVIPLGVIVVYYLLRGTGPEKTIYSSLLWGLPLALGIAAIWYGPVIWKHGSVFINRFIIEHHFARYVTDRYRHPAPVYFYLFIVPALTLPWTPFLVQGLWRVRKLFWRPDTASSKLQVFATAWLMMPLIFFSFSSSKLPGYVLPVLPAAALIAGNQIALLASSFQKHDWPIKVTGCLCLIAGAIATIYAWRSGTVTVQCASLIALPLALAGGIAVFPIIRPAFVVLLIGAATLISCLLALYCAIPKFVERESAKQLLEVANARGYSQVLIYGLQRDDRTPEFYAAGRIVYRKDGEPVFYEGIAPVVVESRRRNVPLLFFMPREHLVYLEKLKPAQFDVIGDNGKTALVAVALN